VKIISKSFKRKAKTMENKFPFNKKDIDALPIPARDRVQYYDAKCAALVLRVSSSGRKTFMFYKRVNNEPIKKNLGEYPGMTIDQARNKVFSILMDLSHGQDPRVSDSLTLGQAFQEYLSGHLKKNHRTSWQEHEKNFQRSLAKWSNKPLDSIKYGHVERLHQMIGSTRGHYAANRMIQQLRAIYNKMKAWRMYKGDNPAEGITLFPEHPRTRFLNREEIERLISRLPSADDDLRDFVLLAAFMGARKASIYAMRWDQINFAAGTWNCPYELQKNGQAKVFALTARELEVLHNRLNNNSEFVFPSTGGRNGKKSASGHIVDLKNQWMRLRKDAKLEDVHIHDLRRNLASWMVQSGVDLKVIQSSMNHKDLQTTAMIYGHTVSETERAAKEVAHANMLGETAQVVPIKRARRK
jgi:integrase